MTLPWTILQSTEVCSNVWIYRLRSPLPFDSAPGILVSIVPLLEPFQTLLYYYDDSSLPDLVEHYKGK